MDEEEYKDALLRNLNCQNEGWVDGDKVGHDNEKTADLVNEEIKVVVEIKDVGLDISDLSQQGRRMKGASKDANEKFERYPQYTSIVLCRIQEWPNISMFIDILEKFVLAGQTVLDTETGGVGKKSSFFTSEDESIENVGGWLIPTEDGYVFYRNVNPNVLKECIPLKGELEQILGRKVDYRDFN